MSNQTIIKDALSAGDGIVLVADGRERPMPTFARDEITKLWDGR